jgi:hypothetical protein
MRWPPLPTALLSYQISSGSELTKIWQVSTLGACCNPNPRRPAVKFSRQELSGTSYLIGLACITLGVCELIVADHEE